MLALTICAIPTGCASGQPPAQPPAPLNSIREPARRHNRGAWQMFSINGYPQGIVRTKDGNFWIADGDMTDTLSRLTPQGQVTYYSIGYMPLEMTLDSKGNFWLTVARDLTTVIRVTPDLRVSSYHLTDDTSGGIAVGGDRDVWFVETTHVGKITPAGRVTEYPTPEIAGSSGITWAPDGLVWFETTGGLASLNPKSGTVTTYATPSATGGAIVPDSTGALWYLVHVTGSVTMIAFDPKRKRVSSYDAPPNFLPYGAPAGMILTHKTTLWYTVQRLAGGKVKRVVGGGLVRFDISSKRFTTYAAPKGYGWNWDVTCGSAGTLWATAGASAAALNPR